MTFPFPSAPLYDRRLWQRLLSRRGGPVPTVGVLALLANIGLLFILDNVVGVKLFTALWLGTMILWVAVFGVAVVGSAARAIRAFYRLGIWGWSRPRWWFEASHLAWILCVLGFLAIAATLLEQKIPGLRRWVDAQFLAARAIVNVSICTFFVTAIIGYATSVITGRRRCGDAYECVQVIFGFGTALTLLAIACVNWPPQRAWPGGVLLAACAISGIALLAATFVPFSSDPRVRNPRWLKK